MADLNDAQNEAIKYIDGPCLVLAGAGSGKTRVITQKIAYLVQQCNTPAHKIVALTFTNEAAREMKSRVSQIIKGSQSRGLTVSTFHNLGLKIIRSECKKLGLKSGFSIFDAQDSGQLIKELLLRDHDDAADLVQLLQSQISSWKNDLVRPSEAISYAKDSNELMAATVYEHYDRHLRAYNAVDFDDLILLPTLLFKDDPSVLERWQNRVHYMLVDEYQDTNTSQYLLVKLLTGVRCCFTVVGDDDQSIYSWRGARPENLALLASDYPKLKVIKLEQNYRSTRTILAAANHVIKNNPHVFEKRLWSELGVGDEIRIIQCKNEDQEAERTASALMSHKLRYNCHFQDYAILYRGNFQSRIIELKLQQLQIPYHVSGGTAFFSRAEVKDTLAYLRLVFNPDDDNAFLRIVNTPRREIGSSTLLKLGEYAQSRETSLFQASQEFGLQQILNQRNLERLLRFVHWIEKTQQNFETNCPAKAMKEMVDDTGYEAWLFEQNKNAKAAERKMENIQQLIDTVEKMTKKAEEEGDEASLKDIVNKLILRDLLEQQEEANDLDRVQLMTLHASKGLEFPYVFLIGMEEELLPHRNSIEENTIEEERRLFYVGITRAQRQLTLSLTSQRKTYGETSKTIPSRFLDELPEEGVIWENKDQPKPEEEKKAIAQTHLSHIRSLLGEGS